MFDQSDRNEISINSTARDWLKSDKLAVNRWWWFWNQWPVSHALLGVVFTPVACWLLWHIAVGPAGWDPSNAKVLEETKVLILAFFLWLLMIYVFYLMFKEHLKHALSLKFTDTGIELKNKFASRAILWSSIKQVLPTSAGEFLVSTIDGSYYFPADQQWSEAAVQSIRRGASIHSQDYSVIMSLDPKFKLTWLLVSIPVAFSFLFQFFKPLIHGEPTTTGYLLAVLLFAAPVGLIFGILYYIQIHSVPETFLAGETILVVDRDGEHKISLSEIEKVRMIGAVCWISTKQGSWFVPLGSVVDRSLPRVPFSKNKLKAQQASIKKAKQQMLTLEPKRLR